ncbi:MAG: pyridoxamine 5'-phosphate oxidase family protein [Burkholderiaceae bacterium]
MKSVQQNHSKAHFHEGEIRAQRRIGVESKVGTFADQAIRSYMSDQHREFFANLPFIVVAAKDHDNRSWVSLLCGEPGFIQSPDAETLTICAALGPDDALSEALEADASIGLLGIMLDARRRNRMNGQIVANDDGVLQVRVGQSFGNCPQYISTRQWLTQADRATDTPARRSKSLDSRMQQMIAGADTLFLGTGHLNSTVPEANGMDASHRGGVASFVSIVSKERLVLPDYAGNKMFNTVGNLLCDPGIGLLFIDFDSGSILQLTGHATIDWESPVLADYPGARRLIHIDIQACVLIENALPIRWQPPSGGMRELRLQSKKAESADITSFVFTPRDGGPLTPFIAGQHLPIEVRLRSKQSVARSYSLSGAADLESYRISVKRLPEGLVSNHLHDHLQPGDTIPAAPPAGDLYSRMKAAALS